MMRPTDHIAYIIWNCIAVLLTLVILCQPASAQITDAPGEITSYIATWNLVVSSSTPQERHYFIAQGGLDEPQASGRLERVRIGIMALRALEAESRSPARVLAPGAHVTSAPGPYYITLESIDKIDSDRIRVMVSLDAAPADSAVVRAPGRRASLLWILTPDGWRLKDRLIY